MKNNVLDIKTLSQLEQDQYPIGEVKLKVGEQTFTVKYQKQFRDSEIQELVKEWILIKEATEGKIEVNMYDISFILVLKHFTDVPFEDITNILDRTEHYIRMTNLLVDLKDDDGVSLFEKIFKSLDSEQLGKTTRAMAKVSQVMLEEALKLQDSEEYKYLKASLEKEGK